MTPPGKQKESASAQETGRVGNKAPAASKALTPTGQKESCDNPLHEAVFDALDASKDREIDQNVATVFMEAILLLFFCWSPDKIPRWEKNCRPDGVELPMSRPRDVQEVEKLCKAFLSDHSNAAGAAPGKQEEHQSNCKCHLCDPMSQSPTMPLSQTLVCPECKQPYMQGTSGECSNPACVRY